MIDLKQITFIGNDLVRPECVLTTRSGNHYVSDFRGGITQINARQQQTFYGGGEVAGYGLLKPNGIALLQDGSFLVAHLGDKQGGIFKITRDSKITPFLTEIDGEPIPPSNFVHLDHQGRIWITISTRKIPRATAYRSDIKDGFIIVVDSDGARIVADNIGYTNEVYVTTQGNELYVNATFSRELIRYTIAPDNSLISPQVVCKFGHGVFPDGLTMDVNGHLWVSSIVSNRIIRVNPEDGTQTVIIEDCDAEHLKWVERAYKIHGMGRPHLDNIKSTVLQNISSLAFGGKDLSTIYLGCLLGKQLASCQSYTQGMPPAHWDFDG